MRKLFEIDESEKQRILEMHINASKRHYLIEQDRTTGTVDAGKKIYGLSPYYLSVNMGNIAIANPNESQTEFFDSEYTASGDVLASSRKSVSSYALSSSSMKISRPIPFDALNIIQS